MDAFKVQLRPIPHPYRSVFAICSDLDETPDERVYRETMRFLNTTADTEIGPGLGLEVGNTIYFDMPPDQFAYWNTDDAGREILRTLIRSGYIDCLHSYGDLAATRDHALRALDELASHDCKLEVWIDHSVAPSNFGADIMRGLGDVPGSDVYHADLTCDFGIKYVWRGRVTSVIGQDAPAGLGVIFNAGRPIRSAKTVAKETVKHVLARCGNRKYAMHGPNRALRIDCLRDGRKVYEFIRCNPYYGGVSVAATAPGLAEVLTEPFLERLVDRQGVCILYTHLGKIKDPGEIFPYETKNALQLLARYYRDNKILVTTTHRLLRYLAVRDNLRYRTERIDNNIIITIEAIDDPVSGTRRPSIEEVQGITFVVPRNEQVKVRILNDQNVACETVHMGDSTYVMIPWQRLIFPDVPTRSGKPRKRNDTIAFDTVIE